LTASPLARDLLIVALGLGTLLYPYGVIFVGHGLAAAAAFGGYMVLARGQRRADLAWAGFLAGWAVMFEYQAVLVALALAAYALHRHRARVVAFLLGALPPAAALAVYHTALFG